MRGGGAVGVSPPPMIYTGCEAGAVHSAETVCSTSVVGFSATPPAIEFFVYCLGDVKRKVPPVTLGESVFQ